jgi:hypothetical protein
MKLALLATCLAVMSTAGHAGLMKIETTAQNKGKSNNWIGDIKAFDPDTGLVTFGRMSKGVPATIDVHFTRIYSFESGGTNIDNSDFPPTQSKLTEPLPSSLRLEQIYVVLNDDGFLADDLPQDVRALPGGTPSGARLTVRGKVIAHNGQSITIEALNKRGTDKRSTVFDVPASALFRWIRGR